MTEERLRVLLRNAIELLQERVFDNYETEAMDSLGMSKDEYCDVMCCDYWDDEEEGNEEEGLYSINVMKMESYKVWAKTEEEAFVKAIDCFKDDDEYCGSEEAEKVTISDCTVNWFV